MNGVLDQLFHSKIIADRKSICAVAGINDKHLRESMTGYCSHSAIEWVRHFNQYEAEGSPGILITLAEVPGTVCQAIAGALVRNYIDARVMSLNSVFAAINDGFDLQVPHVLLIPNMYVHALGTSIHPWRIQVLHDLLLARTLNNRTNVLYVESIEGLKSAYGNPFAAYLTNYKHC